VGRTETVIMYVVKLLDLGFPASTLWN